MNMFFEKDSVNFGVISGRVARKPFIRENQDGSRTAFLKLHTDRPYSQYIDLQGYTTAECARAGEDPFESIKKGDALRINYYVRAWYDKRDGRNVFRQDLQIIRMRRIRTQDDPEGVLH